MSTKTFEQRPKEYQKEELAKLFSLPESRIQEGLDNKGNKIFIAEISATNLISLNIEGNYVYAKNANCVKGKSKNCAKEVYLFSQKYGEVQKRPIAKIIKNKFESFQYAIEGDKIRVEIKTWNTKRESYGISAQLNGYSQMLIIDFLQEVEKSFYEDKNANQGIEKIYDFFRKNQKITHIRIKSS